MRMANAAMGPVAILSMKIGLKSALMYKVKLILNIYWIMD